MARKFHALTAGGYANDRRDYVENVDLEEAEAMLRQVAPYMADPSVHLFNAERAPWEEHDAYPDRVMRLHGRRVVSEPA